MNYISLFSGIEAASVAWEPLGWHPVAFAEIEPFCCELLRERFPAAPNLGDVCNIDWKEFIAANGRPDVIVGGSPCQSFSVAGGRESLSGESRLCFEYVRAVGEIKPDWFVWENVPGVLNTRDNAFGKFVCALWDCGYRDMSWRVLDAQFFGVAQRRRRVFLVGHIGDGLRSAAVLFERDSLRGDHPTSREKRAQLAARAGRGAAVGDGGRLTPWGFSYKVSATAGSVGFDREIAPSLLAGRNDAACVYVLESTQSHASVDADVCGCVTAHAAKDAPVVCMSDGYVVRRLTPMECERLQGFPDGWTQLGDTPDTPRYKALGNSMAVPVMRWIGNRIGMVDELMVSSCGK